MYDQKRNPDPAYHAFPTLSSRSQNHFSLRLLFSPLAIIVNAENPKKGKRLPSHFSWITTKLSSTFRAGHSQKIDTIKCTHLQGKNLVWIAKWGQFRKQRTFYDQCKAPHQTKTSSSSQCSSLTRENDFVSRDTFQVLRNSSIQTSHFGQTTNQRVELFIKRKCEELANSCSACTPHRNEWDDLTMKVPGPAVSRSCQATCFTPLVRDIDQFLSSSYYSTFNSE